MIEQVKNDNWGGTIRVRTQGRGAAALLERLVHWIGEEQARAGLNPDDVVLTPPRIAGWDDDRMGLQTTLTEAHVPQDAITAAIEHKVFGSPFVVVDGEAFFGVDRLPQIAAKLAGAA